MPPWAGVVALALAARLGAALIGLAGDDGRGRLPLFWNADTPRYLELSASLLTRFEFATAAGPETYRLPGYPLLLMPGVALAAPALYALLVQALACALLAVVVFDAARLVGLGTRAALLAGALCAVEPTLLAWSLHLMADSLLATVVGAALWAWFRHLRTGSVAALGVAGALAGCAALVKPVAVGLALVIGLLAVKAGRGRGARLLLVATLPALLVLGGWHLRNHVVAGFTGFTTQWLHLNRSADYAVWRSAHPGATREERLRERSRRGLLPADWARQEPLRVEAPLVDRLRVHVDGVARSLVNPGVLIWVQLVGLEPRDAAAPRELHRAGTLLFFTRSFSERPHVVAATAILGSLLLGYWALAVVGLKEVAARSPAAAWGAVAFIGYFALAAGGPWGESRFRVPFTSALCLLAGAGLERLLRGAAAGASTASTAYRSFWDGVSSSFPDLGDALSTRLYRSNEEWLLRNHLPPAARLLKTDLWDECRNTRILQWAARGGASAYGVDIALGTVRQAQTEFPRGALRGAVADVRQMPFASGSFDAVYSMGTIEHFAESERAFAEIARVLRPGGVAIVGVPNRHDPFLRPLVVALLYRLGLYGYGYEKSFSRRALREMARRVGLSPVEDTGILFVPGWLRMFELLCWQRMPRLVPLAERLIAPFVWLDGRTSALRRFGYLVVCVARRPGPAASRP